MAGLIVVCPRTMTASRYSVDEVLRCAKLMEPDNIAANPTQFHHEDGFIAAVVNPVRGMRHRDGSVCIGSFCENRTDWWKPGAPEPDGSYVLCRYASRSLELMTDALASRTMWYVEAENALLASTSQRALVALLGDYRMNEQAVSWMLCSGHLGSEASWDSRLRRLPANASLTLDRTSGRVKVHTSPMSFDPENMADDAHIGRLREVLLDTCSGLDLALDDWLLLLSGGLDSRALLYALVAAGERPRCVTWGLKSSLADPTNDASIAPRLAQQLNVSHTYYPLDDTEIALGPALTRWVLLSEGRTEDFAAYVDGFAMWKAFFESGVAGVLRGDEPSFGYHSSYGSLDQARIRTRMHLLSDHRPDHPVRRLGLPEISPPSGVEPLPGETPVFYQARLYEEFFVPGLLAPLNDLKGRYIEVVNPLQSRAMLRVTHRLPAQLRTERRSLDAVVGALGPRLPYATAGAPPRHDYLVGRPELANEITTWLESDDAERVLSHNALRTVIAGLSAEGASAARQRLRRSIRTVVPRKVLSAVRPLPTVHLSGQRLAFRTYVAVRIASVLSEDAGLLKP
jgi:hypothetical protein